MALSFGPPKDKGLQQAIEEGCLGFRVGALCHFFVFWLCNVFDAQNT
jgi:hypothetical protein